MTSPWLGIGKFRSKDIFPEVVSGFRTQLKCALEKNIVCCVCCAYVVYVSVCMPVRT